KPDPKVLEVVLDRLGGLDPEDALFIGDAPTDAAAAASIGMPYAGVLAEGVLATVDGWLATQADAGERAARWERPVPLVGDTTSAAARAADPSGWRLGDDDRAGLYTAIGARRDVRRFRPDPVLDD